MKKLIFVLAAAAALLAGVLLFQHFVKPAPPENALYYQKPRVVKPFQLTDHQGEQFSNAQLQGKWSFLFLGYMSCPDVCPTTLQEFNFAYQDLKNIAKHVQVLLVSADPNRDSIRNLSQYINYFNSEFIALRGEHGALFPFVRNLGLMYGITDENSEEGYLVDHSASVVLINPEGQIAAIFKPQIVVGQPPAISSEILVNDFAKIVALN